MRSSKRALSSRRVFVGGEVALGLFGEDAEHVDALARAEEVDLGLLALGRGAAELHDGRHVDATGRCCSKLISGGCVHAGVGGADGGVETVGGRLVGAAGLLGLLGGGRRRQSSAGDASAARRLGCGGAAAELARQRLAARRGGGIVAFSSPGEGSASGRSSPSTVNLRRSVTTKGLFCSDMVTLFQKIQMLVAARWASAVVKGWATGTAVPPG